MFDMWQSVGGAGRGEAGRVGNTIVAFFAAQNNLPK